MKSITSVTMGLSGACLAFFAGWQSKTMPPEIRTTRLVLVDARGRDAATLSTTDGGVKLEFSSGNTRVELTSTPKGAALILQSGGSTIEQLAGTSSASMTVARKNGSHVFTVAGDATAFVSCKNEAHKRSAFLGAEEVSSVLRLFSPKYYTVISTYDDFNAFTQDRQREPTATGGGLGK